MRIAIIRLSALGDIIICASFLKALKDELQAQIEWFVDEEFCEILDNSPCIDELHVMPFKKLLKSLEGIKEIKKYANTLEEFDLVIDTQGLIKSALIGKFLKSKKYIGFSFSSAREKVASFFYNRKIVIPYNENILKRNFATLFNQSSSPSEYLIEKYLLSRKESFGFNTPSIELEDMSFEETRVLFILEASKKEKSYPIESFARLAKKIANFHKNNYEIFLIWHDDELNASNLLDMLLDCNINATKLPKLDLNAVKFVISHMDCTIGGDTGITHLAWAMQKPSITLYGNKDEPSSSKSMDKTPLSRLLLKGRLNFHLSIPLECQEFDIKHIEPKEVFLTYEKLFKIKG